MPQSSFLGIELRNSFIATSKVKTIILAIMIDIADNISTNMNKNHFLYAWIFNSLRSSESI